MDAGDEPWDDQVREGLPGQAKPAQGWSVALAATRSVARSIASATATWRTMQGFARAVMEREQDRRDGIEVATTTTTTRTATPASRPGSPRAGKRGASFSARDRR